jgi:hypothetical protein
VSRLPFLSVRLPGRVTFSPFHKAAPVNSNESRNRILGAAGLVVAAAVVAVFTSPFVVQAFRGPRTVTEQELLAIQEPGSWDNYVRFTPSRPATDTGVRYGKKGNEGTKYVLLQVGDRALFCSARIANNGPDYVGRLGSLGSTEEEAVRRIGGNPGTLLPFMLQSVRNIWFDTVVALVTVVGCLGGALWLLLAGRRSGWHAGDTDE